MFCPNCGEPVQEHQKFCNHCGAKLKTQPETPATPAANTSAFANTESFATVQAPDAAQQAPTPTYNDNTAVNTAAPNPAFEQAYQEVHPQGGYATPPAQPNANSYTGTVNTAQPTSFNNTQPNASCSESWTADPWATNAIPLDQTQKTPLPGSGYANPNASQAGPGPSASYQQAQYQQSSYQTPPAGTYQQPQQAYNPAQAQAAASAQAKKPTVNVEQEAAEVRARIGQYPSVGKYLMQENFFDAHDPNRSTGFFSRMPSAVQILGVVLLTFALIIFANVGSALMIGDSVTTASADTSTSAGSLFAASDSSSGSGSKGTLSSSGSSSKSSSSSSSKTSWDSSSSKSSSNTKSTSESIYGSNDCSAGANYAASQSNARGKCITSDSSASASAASSGGSAYVLKASDMGFFSALEAARAYSSDSHLAIINSQAELDQLVKMANQERANGSEVIRYYVGARRDINGSTYYLTDNYGNVTSTPLNSVVSTSSWMKDEPSLTDKNTGDLETVVALTYIANENTWQLNDVNTDIVGNYPEYQGEVGYIIEVES